MMELKLKNIPEILIEKGVKEIDEQEYIQVLKNMILKKKREIKPGKSFIIREKIINFATGKGYEMQIILDVLKELKI
jgi:regulatory protein